MKKIEIIALGAPGNQGLLESNCRTGSGQMECAARIRSGPQRGLDATHILTARAE